MTPRAARLSALLEGAGIVPLAPPGADPIVRGVTLDSRAAGPGDLFFALRGLAANGEDFAPQAVDRGATAVVAGSPRPAWIAPDLAWVEVAEVRRSAALLARECHARPDERLRLVGVTGTNGKTTVTWLLESIARAAGFSAGRIGTTGYVAGGVARQGPRTTPEAPAFYRMLEEMADHGVEVVAAEISSHALALCRVEGARFRVAAFLNLSRDHLDFHGDSASYFEAKARLFDALGPEDHAVLPADDRLSVKLAARTRGRVLTWGRSDKADLRVGDEHCGLEGSSAVLRGKGGAIPVRTRLLGRFNLDNVAAAAACAVALGLPADAVTSGVLAVETVPGRMERIDDGQGFPVVVDYAHTPDALEKLLVALRDLRPRRLLVVFGCGGERDRGKRAPMGRVAAEHADRVWITSDNPRGEDPRSIVDAIAEGAAEAEGGMERTRLVVDRTEAIGAALADAGLGDIVAIAGKGHETTQTIGDTVIPFDDREVAARALARLRSGGGSRA